MHAAPEELLTDLTPPQREAVLCTEGPLLVLAGPGSGKTRVITRRIAHLISQGHPPWSILAVTFTNKAAGEMKHRVASLVGEQAIARGLTVTTFHSLCVRLLRRYVELWAYEKGRAPIKPDFTVFDADDQASLIKKVLTALDLSGGNWPPRSVLSHISSAKNDLLDCKTFAEGAWDFHSKTIARVYERYDHALREAGAADFDDLLMLTARMLRESSAVREEVRRRYRYLLVDEYQDTNKAQFVIASLIAGEEGAAASAPEAPAWTPRSFGAPAVPERRLPNICVVGDPDQSIYGWRGADIANILQFEEHYPSAKVIALGENFRSRAPIIAAADRLIRNNKKRKHKPLIAMRDAGDGGGVGGGGRTRAASVEVVLCQDEHHEAALVLDWLRLRRERGEIEWKDAAVFYRTNALSRVMEDTLRAAGVPYTIVRGTAFYQREEIKTALAYLRVVANPLDTVSLGRVINTPARGIGDASLEKVESAAAQRGVTTLDMLRAAKDVAGLPTRTLNAITKFMAMLDSWSPRPSADEMFTGTAYGSLAELVGRVVRESGLEAMYAADEDRAENLAELVSSAREFEEEFAATGQNADPGGPPPESETDVTASGPPTLLSLLHAYLERVALVADTDALDPAQGAVTLMTLHAAKGLEYKAVALIGLEESILPHMRSQESEAALEEERRLCFVGVTRAMDALMITSAKYRTLRGIPERMIPSRFLDELKGEGVTISDQAGGISGFDDDGTRDFIERGGDNRDAFGGRPSAPPERRIERDDDVPFPPGCRVRHPQFGVGVVEAATSGSDARVKVKFAGIGVKTLVLAYARLAKA